LKNNKIKQDNKKKINKLRKVILMINKIIIILNKIYRKSKANLLIRNHLLYTQIFVMINIYIIEKHLGVQRKKKVLKNKKSLILFRSISRVNKLAAHVQVD